MVALVLSADILSLAMYDYAIVYNYVHCFVEVLGISVFVVDVQLWSQESTAFMILLSVGGRRQH
jgi:hypothetical protein